MSRSCLAVAALLLALSACHAGKSGIVGGERVPQWSGVAPGETLHATGAEPFWSAEVSGRTLTWKTPEDQAGTEVTVERFAGRDGIGFSGTLSGSPFELAVSDAQCSDGMSDRRYPFAVTVLSAGRTLRGCGWTDKHPFSAAAKR